MQTLEQHNLHIALTDYADKTSLNPFVGHFGWQERREESELGKWAVWEVSRTMAKWSKLVGMYWRAQ